MKTQTHNSNIVVFADGFHVNTIVNGNVETFAIAYSPLSWANQISDANEEKIRNAKLITDAVNNYSKLQPLIDSHVEIKNALIRISSISDVPNGCTWGAEFSLIKKLADAAIEKANNLIQ